MRVHAVTAFYCLIELECTPTPLIPFSTLALIHYAIHGMRVTVYVDTATISNI